MIEHTQLDIYGFKEAIKNTEEFKNIKNTEIQKLYFKMRTLDEFFQNYKWGIREGIDYLKKKKSVSGRDVRIIEEILNK
mgnify:CR=1 FL=1